MSSSSSWSGDIVLRSSVLSIGPRPLFGNALNEARLDRKLGGCQIERLAGDRRRHAIDLEQDAPRLDARNPVFRRAFARPHAHLERLLRYRNVRKHADPNPAGALHVARHDPVRLHRFQAELAKAQGRTAGGDALDPALVLLAELGATGLQHDATPLLNLNLTR